MTPGVVSFTRVRLPYGWLGNMAPYPVYFGGARYPTAEHLFQCWRFVGDSEEWPGDEDATERAEAIRAIRGERSPMSAKMRARAAAHLMVVAPRSESDVLRMGAVLCLKFAQHPDLLSLLRETGDATIVEDSSKRPSESGLFWGARRTLAGWEGQNTLGALLGGVRAVSLLVPDFARAVCATQNLLDTPLPTG